MFTSLSTLATFSILLLGALLDRVSAEQILKTSGFSSCLANATISVQRSAVEYNNDLKQVTFDLAGTSTKETKVTADLVVLAYGTEVYRNSFNPCADSTFVQQLCPGTYGWDESCT